MKIFPPFLHSSHTKLLESKRSILVLSACFLISLTLPFLSGCSPEINPTPSDSPSPTQTPDSTLIVGNPSDTPEPAVPAVVLAADATTVNAGFLSHLSLLLQEQGFVFSIRSASDSGPLPSSTRYLLVTNASDLTSDLSSALTDLPDLPVLSFSPDNNGAASPPHLLYTDAYYQRAAFLAGYASAFLTPDYRTGYVDLVGSEINGLYDAFFSGSTYYCGHCSPSYPPFLGYPISVQLSMPFTSEKISAVLSALQQDSVTTVYLHPFIQSEELCHSLKSAGITLLGNQLLLVGSSPLFDLVIGPDSETIAKEILPALTQGILPEPLLPPVKVLINSGLISDGRMNHLDEVINMLNEGTILPVE